MADMIEIPLERAQAFRNLLSAAQRWRSERVGNTANVPWPAAKELLAAVAALDPEPCDHPRSWRIYRVASANADEVCARCATVIVAGLTPLPIPSDDPPPGPVLDDPPTSSPPESSPSSP